jgi:hypothetical protein
LPGLSKSRVVMTMGKLRCGTGILTCDTVVRIR